MSGAVDTPTQSAAPPEFRQVLGHPQPLWMLFMTEFWERFAFYGIRWALTLYVVAQFYQGSGAGEKPANLIYGAYLALVYAGAIFGGFIADRVIGYQRSILVGAVVMSIGLFLIAIPNQDIFRWGLATVVVGNGLFKPNISTMVGKLYRIDDQRRDSGFTIFYMGINAGALFAPWLTGLLATSYFGTDAMPAYKVVFIASGIGMLISFVWFWFGRRGLQDIGRPIEGAAGPGRVILVVVGMAIAIPIVYALLSIDASLLGWVLIALFVGPAVMLLVEGMRIGTVARDKVIAMLIIFAFNVLFWMFFEQAGSSFNFLAEKIVNRQFGSWEFPVAWFQTINSIAIIAIAPVLGWVWVRMRSANPSIPRKFGLGILFNAVSFLLLMVALSSMVDTHGKIPFWTLTMVYVLQSVGELCLSPIGLSMVTKLAPERLVGFAMGAWFLSIAIGDNLSGIFASAVSGEGGLTVASAQHGYTFGFWIMAGFGVLLFLIAPLVNRLMHGVK